MKTAMQELIDELESIKNYKYKELTIRLVKEKIKKEKEQIMNAHTEGYSNYDSEMTSVEYYNQTYKQNK
jgi:hypothetical protein